jgi:drug/metabolite transporter (DMT)-like permease
VLFLSQPPTLALIAAVVIVRGVPFRPGPWMVAGLLAGFIGVVGLAAIYRGMAIGVAFATTIGLLSVVSIVSSHYPVATVVLARIVLDERVAPLHQAGIGLALTCVGLISL